MKTPNGHVQKKILLVTFKKIAKKVILINKSFKANIYAYVTNHTEKKSQVS